MERQSVTVGDFFKEHGVALEMKPLAGEVGFDRIIREPDGSRTAQTRPEDWELSRAMDAASVKYGATWALPVMHYGNGAWANRP